MGAKITEYVRPRSIREATNVLRNRGRNALVVGGGVSLVLSGSPRPIHAVDLSNLGLNRIERRQRVLRLGSTVSLEDLVQSHELVTVWNGLLPEACRTAATKAVRDLITVGGNIVQCYYWSTLPPLLLAVEGKIIVAGPGKTRTIPAAEFFAVHPRKFLQPGEIVTRVDIPLPGSSPASSANKSHRHGAAFLKFAKTYNDYAIINACAVVRLEGRVIHSLRLALGALDTLPTRCTAAEEALVGHPYDDQRARDAIHTGVERLDVREDFRASPDYRRHVAAVYLHRALAEAWRRAAGNK